MARAANWGVQSFSGADARYHELPEIRITGEGPRPLWPWLLGAGALAFLLWAGRKV